MATVLKQIGASGQISLGKEHAGKTVLVEETEPGTWVVKVGTFIPDSERWMWTPENKALIDEGLAWIAKNPPHAANLNELMQKVSATKRPKAKRRA